ncbi:hypothetical protein [Paraburkholderia caballeronis]|uniref:hypothetical protein n=1 Tax=Paraburkholderia caballeronis TaxID=416943 RepID=UPI0010654567|nr:hypothetical protein [Paraburkholderia caballeronis]
MQIISPSTTVHAAARLDASKARQRLLTNYARQTAADRAHHPTLHHCGFRTVQVSAQAAPKRADRASNAPLQRRKFFFIPALNSSDQLP